MSLSVEDDNFVENMHIENIRVENIFNGQPVNLRVMKNARWTTAPSLGIWNVTLKTIRLVMANYKIVNPSQILGYDSTRSMENAVLKNLKIGDKYIHDEIGKSRRCKV